MHDPGLPPPCASLTLPSYSMTRTAARTSRTAYAPPSLVRLLHSRVTVGRYHAMHFLGALFPLTAGVMLYGWRAAVGILVVVLSAWAAQAVWRRVGRGGCN